MLSSGLLQDLILFPGDASFVKVEQSAWGRTYVLKFSSSNQRHFVRHAPLFTIIYANVPFQFWLQVIKAKFIHIVQLFTPS